MYFHGVEMKGVLLLEKLSSLPSFDSERDKTRLVYNDDDDKIYIGTSEGWREFTLSFELADIAYSGSYDDLSDVPDFADVAYSGSYDDLSSTPDLHEVAISGDYRDLRNKIENLNDLDDLDVASPLNDEVLKWNEDNSVWEPKAIGDIVDLTDSVTSVFGREGSISAEQDDYAASQVTNDSGVSGDFVDDALDNLQSSINDLESEIGGNGDDSAGSIDDLNDVSISAPKGGHILTWDSSENVWKNGGNGFVTYHFNLPTDFETYWTETGTEGEDWYQYDEDPVEFEEGEYDSFNNPVSSVNSSYSEFTIGPGYYRISYCMYLWREDDSSSRNPSAYFYIEKDGSKIPHSANYKEWSDEKEEEGTQLNSVLLTTSSDADIRLIAFTQSSSGQWVVVKGGSITIEKISNI